MVLAEAEPDPIYRRETKMVSLQMIMKAILMKDLPAGREEESVENTGLMRRRMNDSVKPFVF